MRIWKEIWDYAKMIIIVVVIVTLVNSVVLINAKIPSESMEKTIMTGDRIFGFRLAYGLNLDFFGHEISKKIKDPERFDIVIFKYPDDESKLSSNESSDFREKKYRLRTAKSISMIQRFLWMTVSFRKNQGAALARMKFPKTAISSWVITAIIPKTPVAGKAPVL